MLTDYLGKRRISERPPTEFFTGLEPENPPNEVSELHKIPLSPDFVKCSVRYLYYGKLASLIVYYTSAVYIVYR